MSTASASARGSSSKEARVQDEGAAMRLVKILAGLAMGLMLVSGCAYHRPAKEIENSYAVKKGPGLYTGKSGEWTSRDERRGGKGGGSECGTRWWPVY